MTYRAYKVSTPSAVLPVSVADMKVYLRVDQSSEDSLIQAQIEAAAAYLENDLSCALLTQTIQETHDGFPKTGEVKLRIYPVISLTSATYTDSSGSSATWDAANYTTANLNSSRGQRASIAPKQDKVWPTDAALQIGSVLYTYQAGFGATVADIPKPIIDAIKIMVADMYQARESQVKQLPTTVDFLVQPYKVMPPC